MTATNRYSQRIGEERMAEQEAGAGGEMPRWVREQVEYFREPGMQRVREQTGNELDGNVILWLTDRLTKAESTIRELRADKERLDWIIEHRAVVGFRPARPLNASSHTVFWWDGDVSYTTEGHTRDSAIQGAMMACEHARSRTPKDGVA
jgi:hypothetical protein